MNAKTSFGAWVSVVALLLCAVPQTATAAPPLLGYSGRLYDGDGQPLTGSHTITFRIYDAIVSGSQWFEEQHASVAVADGYFYVLLNDVNDGTDFAALFTANDALYLELEVDGEVLSPRQRMGSVPWALSGAATGEGVLPEACPAGGMVLKFNGSSWVCAEDEVDGGSEAITSVTAHDPLVASVASGDITIALASCSAPGEVETYTGSGWACADPRAGLQPELQLSGTCTAGMFVSQLEPSSGQFTCAAPPAYLASVAGVANDGGDVAFSAGTGMSIAGNDGENRVDFSLDEDLVDLADGSLSGSKVGSGIAGGNLVAASIDGSKLQLNTIDGASLRNGAHGAIVVSAASSTAGADAYCAAAGSIKGSSSATYAWAAGDHRACIQAALDYAEAYGPRRVELLPGTFSLSGPVVLDGDVELVGVGGVNGAALDSAGTFSGTELVTVSVNGADVHIQGLRFILDTVAVSAIRVAAASSFVIEDNHALASATSGNPHFIDWDADGGVPLTTKKVIRNNTLRYLDSNDRSGNFLYIHGESSGLDLLANLEVLDNTYDAAYGGGRDMIYVAGTSDSTVVLSMANIRGNSFHTNNYAECNRSLLNANSYAQLKNSIVTDNRVFGATLAYLNGASSHTTISNNVAQGRACDATSTYGTSYAVSAIDSYALSLLGNQSIEYDSTTYRISGGYAAIIANNSDQNSNRFVSISGGASEVSVRDNGFFSLCAAYGNTTALAPVYVDSATSDRIAVSFNQWRLLGNCTTGDSSGVDWSGSAPANSYVFNQAW